MSKKIIIIVSLICILIAGSVLALLFYPVTINKHHLFNFIKTSYNNSAESKDNSKPLATYQNGYNFDKYYSEIYDGYQFEISSYNPIHPVVSLIAKNRSNSINIDILTLNRTGLDSFEFQTQMVSEIKNKTFSETIEIAKKYDLTKTNPDPANITVYPALSKEEVERQKDSQSVEEKLTKSSAAQAELTDCRRKDANGTFATPKELRDCVNAVKEKYGK